ncbi:hypothetical protein PLESTF_001299400 [Pleodorina starrii]|nr:hypothetical protein PLESTM_001470900 [Pleodorina starrii]GLC72847.1 hypothetical protein PLESTF_001299400 [Pleodorina starrii]
MDFDRENPSPLARLPGGADANWLGWSSPELETAYLQQLAGVERLEDATSLQLVVNTAAGGSVAHLGATLPNLLELNLNGSSLDSLRDVGTGFRLLQVLWVSRCGLKALDGLNGLPSLRELYAAYNDIADLQPVDSCQQLEILDVECNCIPDTDAVLYLAACANLQTLTMAGNPAADKPGYRQAICGALPSLHSLDDQPVTAADRGGARQNGDAAGARSGGGAGPRPPGDGLLLPPSPHRRTSLDAGGGGSAADADEEVAFVVAGIKHARVGVDSQEFREIEMSLLVATADGTDVQLDVVRPGTSTMLPASAGTWVRTLRSSREGSLAALRAAASAAGRTGTHSPASPLSASPIDSRPSSSQQQRGGSAPAAAAAAAPTAERWAVPAGPGAAYGMSGGGGSAAGAGTWRPSSGTGILMGGSGGGAAASGTIDSPMRPGSGGYRLGTGRPYSARPGTAASFSARIGTSASTGAAPASAAVGLYWAKNRIGGGSAAGAAGGGVDGGGAAAGGAADEDVVASSSKLTLGSDTTFGGSFARDLRKWKGAAVRATAAAAGGGGNALSSTLLRGGQLDPRALLEELKRWKLETADKVLFVDPDEAASSEGWAGADGQDLAGSGRLSGGAAAAAATSGCQADILRVSASQDGAGPELAAAFGVGLAGLAFLDSNGAEGCGGGGGAAPDSPLQPPRPPPGAAAAGRRKTVLAKVLRDIAADTIGGSGVCISEILAGLRPVHEPPLYGSGGDSHAPAVAWGPAGGERSGEVKALGGSRERARDREREREKCGWGASTAATPTSGSHHHHQNHHHHHHHHHHHGHSKTSHGQQQQQPQQSSSSQGAGQRPGSARSVCSAASSGQSDSGGGAGGAQGPGTQLSSRPGSREEQQALAVGASGGGGGSGGGAALQRQRSASGRAPGLPTGPSAPSAAAAGHRVATAAGEVDVRASNPSPAFRVGG